MNFPGLPLYLLVVLRTGGVLWAAPVFGSAAVPLQVRVPLAMVLGLIISPLALVPAHGLPADFMPYLLLAAREVVIGLAIGYAASLFFAAFQYAGTLMDLSSGFGMLEAINPLLGISAQPMTNLLYFLVTLFFLVTGGHLLLIMALAESYHLVPVGGGVLSGPASDVFSHLVGNVFALGLTVASPIIGALFFAMVALALLGRTIPQLNIFQVGFSLQTLLGVFTLVLILPALWEAAQGTFGNMFVVLEQLMKVMGG